MTTLNLFDQGHAIRRIAPLERVKKYETTEYPDFNATFWIKAVAVFGRPDREKRAIDTYYVHQKITFDTSLILKENDHRVRGLYPTNMTACAAISSNQAYSGFTVTATDAQPRNQAGAMSVALDERIGSDARTAVFGTVPPLGAKDSYAMAIAETAPLPDAQVSVSFPQSHNIVTDRYASSYTTIEFEMQHPIVWVCRRPPVSMDKSIWQNGALSAPHAGTTTLNMLGIWQMNRPVFGEPSPAYFNSALAIETTRSRIDPRLVGDEAHHDPGQAFTARIDWVFENWRRQA